MHNEIFKISYSDTDARNQSDKEEVTQITDLTTLQLLQS
jgi:hypothetical protein